ncbi:MAG TPA: OmpA family protein [Comamonas denitrificans]|nr:OmpA family protein [Comamonas denitrificans]
MPAANGDDQQRFALGLVFTLVAAVVASVIGFAAQRSGLAVATTTVPASATAATAAAVDATPAPLEPAALAPAAVVLTEQAAVRVDGNKVKFFFAKGKTDVAPGAQEALATVLEGAKAGQRIRISGFHDATGDAALNVELAKRRAVAVRDLLLSLGVDEALLELVKPEHTLANGSNDKARRVEVLLID